MTEWHSSSRTLVGLRPELGEFEESGSKIWWFLVVPNHYIYQRDLPLPIRAVWVMDSSDEIDFQTFLVLLPMWLVSLLIRGWYKFDFSRKPQLPLHAL